MLGTPLAANILLINLTMDVLAAYTILMRCILMSVFDYSIV